MKKALLFAAAGILAWSTAAGAGWQYTAVTRAEGGQAHSQMFGSSVQAWVDGGKARIEYVKSGNPMMPAGNYMVTQDGGKTLYLVNPKEKTCALWDMKGLAGMAGGVMQMMGMKISAPKVEKLLEENGGKVAGHPTTHYRFRTSYTTEMNFMGIQRSAATVTEEDIWSSAELNDAGLGVWMNQQGVRTGNEDLDKLVQAQMQTVKGFPLKRTIVTTTQDNNGQTQATTVTTEVTDIKKASPEAALFELPAGYRQTSLLPGAEGGSRTSPGAGKGGRTPPASSQDNPILKIMQEMNKGK